MTESRKPGARSKEELLDKIVADFTQRLRSGKRPSIGRYQKKFPTLHHEINELLSSVAMIEQLKASTTANSGARSDLSELDGLRKIGDYDLIREIGRGGMGIVFEGVHRSLGRKVAVKIMPGGALENDHQLTRFQREAQAAARLHHSNIVSVFGVGNDQGHYYYVMEFIDGFNLSEVVRQLGRISNTDTRGGHVDQTVRESLTRLENEARSSAGGSAAEMDHEFSISRSEIEQPEKPECCTTIPRGKGRFQWAALLAYQVADALAYAHEQGILHRDIKPSNLILDSSNRVWITDFGLVKNVADQTLTKTGDIVGTIQYMPAEAFQGLYDARSETYGLGLTLYELVMLEPVVKNMSTPEMIHAIMNETPAAPNTQDRRIPKDLSTIISKSIAREPEARYQTAAEMRDDLRAFIEDRPIVARRPSAVEQAFKWARRNPMAASLAGLSMFLLLAVAVVSTIAFVATNNAYVETNRAYEVASSRATRLKQEYDRAEANVELTIEAFDNLYRYVVFGKDAPEDSQVDGFRELVGVETMVTEDDAALMQSLIQFYDRFAEQNQGNEKLIAESAKALRRVANIYMLLGETEKALNVYRSSVGIYKEQLEADPESLERLLDFVRTNNEYANALQHHEGLGGPFQDAIQRSIKTLTDSPNAESRAAQLELARTFNYMGTSASLSAVTLSAVTNGRRDTRFFPRRQGRGGRDLNGRPAAGADRRPGNGAHIRPKNGNNGRPAGVRPPSSNRREPARGRGQIDTRQVRYNRRATDIIERLLKSTPDDPELKIELAKSYSYLALFQLSTDRNKSADYLEQSIHTFDALLKADPKNPELSYRLALACAMPTAHLIENGREMLDRSLQLVDQLTARYPLVLEYQQLAAIVYAKKGDVFIRNGKLVEAYEVLGKSSQIYSDIISKTTSTSRLSFLNRVLNKLYSDLIKQLKDHGDTGRARIAQSRIHAVQKLMRERPTNRLSDKR